MPLWDVRSWGHLTRARNTVATRAENSNEQRPVVVDAAFRAEASASSWPCHHAKSAIDDEDERLRRSAGGACGALRSVTRLRRMIDKLPNEIDAAVERLVANLSAVFEAEVRRLRAAAAPANATTEQKTSSLPERASVTDAAASEPPSSSQRVPLSQRPNVFRVPAGTPLPPRSVAKATPPKDVADAAVGVVIASAEPLTMEQIRAKLKVGKDVLAPALYSLVANGKVRMVEQDGTVVYKPPRIEPIKRVRQETE